MQNGIYKKELLIVTPYRNREEHLAEFLKNSPRYFDEQGIDYDILLCELDQVGDWNAGLCVNSLIDFINCGRSYNWLYIHHVDVWPSEGNWCFPENNTIVHNLGDYGSCLLKLEDFLKVNGCCNSFWGWGGEDNELFDKLRQSGCRVISAEKEWPVKYNTAFQNHERKFNGNNYGGGINNLFNYNINNRDNILNFYDHAKVSVLPKISDNIFHQLVTPLKKSPREHKNENVLLGYINSVKDFMYVAPFVKSALIYAPYAYDIVFIISDDEHSLPNYLIDQLTSFGIKIVHDKKTNNNIFIDRYIKYKNFLMQSDYKKCLHVDVTDSYFQSNPFKFLDSNLQITSEGISIEDENWNKNMFLSFYGNELYNKIKEKKVLCGGVVGGDVNKFIDFCELVVTEYRNLNTDTESGIDQIIIQKIIYVDKSIDIQINDVASGFCINLHVYKHYPELINYNIGIHNNKTILLDNSTRFSIVHQYNRLNDLYNNIINHFVNYFYPV